MIDKEADKALIQKMDVVPDALRHYPKIKSPAFAKCPKMLEKLNYQLKVVNFVVATGVIQETIRIINIRVSNNILTIPWSVVVLMVIKSTTTCRIQLSERQYKPSIIYTDPC
jgi:hypothetical protein